MVEEEVPKKKKEKKEKKGKRKDKKDKKDKTKKKKRKRAREGEGGEAKSKARKKSRKETTRGPDDVLTVTTSKKDGIISATLEETNRLRKKLGLKPLKPRSAPAPPPPTEEDTFVAQARAREEHKVKRRQKKHMGLTITQMHGEEEGYGEGSDDVLSWIQKSRKLQVAKELEVAKKRQSMFSDEEDEEEKMMRNDRASLQKYTAAELKGMKVAHDTTQLKPGEQKILVLKDTEVLNEHGSDLNEGEDELMNLGLAKKDIEERNKARKDNVGLGYDPYGDKINTLLPQYDEEMPERMGFRLNEKGEKKASMEENTMDKLSNAMQTDLFTEMQYQKDTYTQEEMAKMFRKRKTKKVKKKKSKRKKVAKPEASIPVELREEMNESEKLRASKPFSERYEFLQNVETTGEDRGKRSDGSLAKLKQKLEDAKADQKRKYNYKKALEKAEKDQWLLRAVEQDEEEAEEERLRKSLKNLEKPAKKNKEESLQQTLERIKKQKQKKNVERKVEKLKDDGLQFTTANVFAFGLRGAVQELNRYDDFSEDEEDEADRITKIKEEMVKQEPGLSPKKKKKREWQTYEHVFKRRPFGLIPSPGGQLGGRGYRIIDVKKDTEARLYAVKKGSILTHINGKDIENWVFTEIRLLLRRASLPCSLKFKWDDSGVLEEGKPLVGRSITDSLKYIGARGILKDDDFENFAGARTDLAKPVDVARKLNMVYLKWTTDDVCKWLEKTEQAKLIRVLRAHKMTGRQMHWLNEQYCRKVLKLRDKDAQILLAEFFKLQGDAAPDVNLEYLDPNTGRPMDSKSAFRNMCHHFHGKRPGKRKQEKRMNRRAEQSARKNRGTIDTPLGTLSMIKQATRTSGKAYVVVDGPESKAGFKNAASNFDYDAN